MLSLILAISLTRKTPSAVLPDKGFFSIILLLEALRKGKFRDQYLTGNYLNGNTDVCNSVYYMGGFTITTDSSTWRAFPVILRCLALIPCFQSHLNNSIHKL